jgi:hypothetical protein
MRASVIFANMTTKPAARRSMTSGAISLCLRDGRERKRLGADMSLLEFLNGVSTRKAGLSFA